MSEGASESPGTLNLAGADLKGFDPIPSGKYDAIVARAEWKYTKGGEDAKMPKGTPMLNIGYTVDGGEYDGRWVWRSYIIPPADYDEKASARMKGMLVRFLMATGYSEDDVTSGDFDIDLDELIDKEVNVQVKINKDGDQNDVTAVRPRGEVTAEASGLL